MDIVKIDKIQEQAVMQACEKVRRSFGLEDLLGFACGGNYFWQKNTYYLHDHKVWLRKIELSAEKESDKWSAFLNPNIDIAAEDIISMGYEKFSNNINVLIKEFWSGEIIKNSGEYSRLKLKELLQSTYTEEELSFIIIRKNDNSIYLYAPKSILLPMVIPGRSDEMLRIELKSSEIKKEVLKKCIEVYNQYNKIFYEYHTDTWQRIHRFIQDERINEQLGLENPPFSLKLYEITTFKPQDYRLFLPDFSTSFSSSNGANHDLPYRRFSPP